MLVVELVVGELVASSAGFRSWTWLVGMRQIMQPCCKQGEFLSGSVKGVLVS